MSTKLGTLTLNLVAKIGDFTRDIQSAESQTSSSFGKMRDSVNKYGMAVAAVAASSVVALAGMAAAYAEEANQLELFAYKAQSTTQEFQKLAIGAKQMGFEAEQVADIFKDFNEKLGEFVTVGGGGAMDFFEQIAIKTEGGADGAMRLAKEMANLSGPQALGLAISRMEEFGLNQDQMSFMLESMGSDLTMLLPLYVNNAEGLKLWGDAAERAGIIMDDKTIKAARELGVQTQMLDMQLDGAKNTLMQAVIPAFVDLTDAFFGGSQNGIQFQGVADGIADTLRFLGKMAIGTATAFQAVGKAIAATAASGGAIANAAKGGLRTPAEWLTAIIGAKGSIEQNLGFLTDDLNGLLDDSANRINSLNGGASIAVQTLADANALSNKLQRNQVAATKGSQEWLDKQNEVTGAISNTAKETNDLANQLKAQADAINYSYMPAIDKLSADHLKAMSGINTAVFADPHKKKLLDLEKEHYSAKLALRQAEFDFEVSGHLLTEEQKLNAQKNIDKLRIKSSLDYTSKERALKIESIEDIARIELEKMQEQKAARIALLHEEMSERIAISQDRRTDSLAQVTMARPAYEQWSLQNEMGSELGWANKDYQADISAINTNDDLSDDGKYAALLEAEEAYQEAKWAIHQEYALLDKELKESQMQHGLDVLVAQGEGMASVWGDILGEQSSAYKAMAAMSKAYAEYQALMNVHETYSNTYDSISAIPIIGPYIAMPMAAAAAATQVAQATMIKGVNLTGMAHDGLDYVPREGTWLLDEGERVVDSRTNSDLKNYLKNGGSTGGVTINNYANFDVNARQNNDGTVTVDILEKKIKQSWGNLGNPNSYESKQIQRNTTAKRERA